MHSPSGADAVLQCYDLAPWPVKAAGPGSCTHTLSLLILYEAIRGMIPPPSRRGTAGTLAASWPSRRGPAA